MKKITLNFLLLCGWAMAGQNAANSELLQQIGETFTSGNWQNDFRGTHTQDANGYIQHVLQERWDVTTSAWKTKNQNTYTVISAGNIDHIINQEWDSQTLLWKNAYRLNYAYNGNGKVLSITTKKWNGTLNIWENNAIEEYSYNGSGYLTGILRSIWNTSTNAYAPSTRDIYTINSAGKPTQIIVQIPVGANVWNDYSKAINTYTSNSLLATTITDIMVSGSWVHSTFQQFSYDSQNRPSQIIYSQWLNSQWSSYYRVNYIYAALSIEDQTAVNVKIYPNPAIDKLYLQSADNFTSMSVYGLDGRLLPVEQNANFIDVSSLECGVYVIEMATDKGITRQKFIKK